MAKLQVIDRPAQIRKISDAVLSMDQSLNFGNQYGQQLRNLPLDETIFEVLEATTDDRITIPILKMRIGAQPTPRAILTFKISYDNTTASKPSEVEITCHGLKYQGFATELAQKIQDLGFNTVLKIEQSRKKAYSSYPY